jgi:hypothetical protein
LPVEDPNAPRCVAYKQTTGSTYFHAQGQVVCPSCAAKIQAGQQAPPAISLGRSALYGLGAALAGCILYAAVAILLDLQIGIIAIAVGFMVGKAVRAGARGLGGRPQQIMAVLMTYFAITTSYIPVYIHELATNPQARQEAKKAAADEAAKNPSAATEKPKMGPLGAILFILLMFAAAPFFGLASGVSGLISLFIIFIGLKQAWRLTARSDILVVGPYETSSSAAAASAQ